MSATLLPLCLAVSSCAPSPSPSDLTEESPPATPPGSAEAQAPCPVTAPNQGAPPDGQVESVHLGNGQLGTDLWPDGIVVARSEFVQPDGSIAVKWPWWRATGEVIGRVEIDGRRIDGPGPPLSGVVPDEGYGDTGFTPSAVIFPSLGCWQVTARVGDASLTFVTRVVPP